MLQVPLKFVLLQSHRQDSAAVFQAAGSRLAVSGESAEARSWRHQWLHQVEAQPMYLPFFNRFSWYCEQHFFRLLLHSRALLNCEFENRLHWNGDGTRVAEVRTMFVVLKIISRHHKTKPRTTTQQQQHTSTTMMMIEIIISRLLVLRKNNMIDD